MKSFKIPISKEEFLYTMPAPTTPDHKHCNRALLQLLKVNVVISLLSQDDVADLELHHESKIYKEVGIGFIHFPIGDFGVPQNEDKFIALVQALSTQIDLGQILAIHCRAGIGRSSLLAAAILIHRGFEPKDVFEHISEHRQTKVPDKRSQAEWLLALSPNLIKKI
jgi:protein-tyrosine phosphatase